MTTYPEVGVPARGVGSSLSSSIEKSDTGCLVTRRVLVLISTVELRIWERNAFGSVAPGPPAGKAQNGSAITEPVSAGWRFTDTTVALGKKLNSEALAQV